MSREPAGKTSSVPRAMTEHYQAVVSITDAFCRTHLNEEYAELAQRAAAALCRKRPSPLLSGNANSWACGIVYAIGQVNFLADKATRPTMSMQDLCRHFGLAASTGGNKAKAVRDALGIRQCDHRWTLPSALSSHPMVWMVEVNGLPVDVRHEPRAVQEAAFARGIIPYVPADGPEGHGGSRDLILARYDTCRQITGRLQEAVETRLTTEQIAVIATRLGAIDTPGPATAGDVDPMAMAADLALFARGPSGRSAFDGFVTDNADSVSNDERRVLAGMQAHCFSIFRVTGAHRGVGVDLVDLLTGETLWVVDRALEAIGYAGFELAMRLFHPDEFWITGFGALPMNAARWQAIEKTGLLRRTSLPTPSTDRDVLAEMIYRLECA